MDGIGMGGMGGIDGMGGIFIAWHEHPSDPGAQSL